MINGSLVTLRPWSLEDILYLQQLRNDINLQSQLMAKPKGSSVEQVKDWISSRSNDPQSIFLVIADRVSNKAIGYLQLVDLDLFVGVGHLGICLSPEVQGQGFGRESLLLLEDYMNKIFCLRKIMLQVLVSNEKAIRFYLLTGFREVGKLLKHHRTPNGFEDVLIMEKLIDQ
jgi:diamine N-acetyltransferase